MTHLSPKVDIIVDGKVIATIKVDVIVDGKVTGTIGMFANKPVYMEEVTLKEQVNTAVGQVWKHDTLRNFKIKILVIHDRHLEVKCMESQMDGMDPGDKYVLEEDVLHKYYTLCESEVKQLYGETCTKCKRIYPHTTKQSDFVCWGCKNF